MKLSRLLATLACAALTAFIHPTFAARGDLDASFGTGGKVTTAVGGSTDIGASVAVQSDQKIIVAGFVQRPNATSDFALVRYNVDGS